MSLLRFGFKRKCDTKLDRTATVCNDSVTQDCGETSSTSPNPSTSKASCSDTATECERVNRATEQTADGAQEKRAVDQTECEPGKRARIDRFQQAWLKTRPWLIYDSKKYEMFCNMCRSYDKSKKPNSFRIGTNNFRMTALQAHEVSKLHILARDSHDASVKIATCGQNTAPIVKCLLKMEETQMDFMKKLFRTALYLAIKERPYADFSDLLRLQSVNFDTNLNDHFANDKQAAIFIHEIAEVYRKEVVEMIDAHKLFGLISDGSTDSAVVEEEIIYVRVLNSNFKPVTKFLALKPVQRANADGILGALTEAMTVNGEQKDWQQNLVSFAADGAAVNFGKNAGVVQKLKTFSPWIIPVHCTAHRLELALKDAAKNVIYMNTLEQFLTNLYKFYHFSPLNWTELQNASDALNINILKPVNIYGTRWVAHRHRALQAVDRDWLALVVHLTDLNQQHANTDKAAKAKGLLNTLLSLEFVIHMHILLPVLSAISALSEALQYNNATLETVVTKLESTIFTLNQIKSRDKIQSMINKQIDLTDLKYKGEKLKIGGAGSKRSALTTDGVVNHATQQCSAYIENTIEAVNKRFAGFKENPVLKAFQIFDPKQWDVISSNDGFGTNEIETLKNHFEKLLIAKGCDPDAIIPEWHELLIYANSLLSRTPHLKRNLTEFWSVVCNNEYPQRFKSVMALVKIMLLVTVSSAEAERGFSLMGLIKTDFRSCLGSQHVTDLMTIKLSGVGLENFNPEPAVANWWAKKQRRFIEPHGIHVML